MSSGKLFRIRLPDVAMKDADDSLSDRLKGLNLRSSFTDGIHFGLQFALLQIEP